MSGYVPVSIPKTSNAGVTKPKVKVLIGRMKDVTTFPAPDDKGISITTDLVMAANANMINLEVTANTISVTQPSEGDPDNKGHKPKIEMSRPGGQDLPFEEFCENNLNEDLFALIQYANGKKKLAGYPGNPLQLTVESTDNNEGDINKVVFESVLRGRRIAIYSGIVPAIADDVAGSGAGA